MATHFSAQTREVLNERLQRVQMPSKTSLQSRNKLRFTSSRTDFSLFLLQDREGERRTLFLRSACICLLWPDPATPSTLVCVSLVLTWSPHWLQWENMWEWSLTVCKIGCFSSSSAFLCFTACTARSPVSLDCNAFQGLDLSLYLNLAKHWEHCWHFANTCHKHI